MIAIRHPKFKGQPMLYVEDVKHKLPNGKTCDWAYTSKSENAMELSDWWVKRFVADMKFCNLDYTILGCGTVTETSL